jgi:hypothetical protein
MEDRLILSFNGKDIEFVRDLRYDDGDRESYKYLAKLCNYCGEYEISLIKDKGSKEWFSEVNYSSYSSSAPQYAINSLVYSLGRLIAFDIDIRQESMSPIKDARAHIFDGLVREAKIVKG